MYVRLARHPLVLAVVFAAYFGLGRLGQFPVPTLGTAPVWPASGFALAAFLLLGRPIWPAVLLASFLVQFSGTGALIGAAVVSLGNTAEGLFAAALIRRYANGPQAFLKAETIFRFAGLAAIAMAIGATTGSLAEFLADNARVQQLPYIWMTWWLSHVTGCLVITPLILLWSPPLPERMRVLEMLEAVGLLAALVGVGLLVFGGRYPSDVKDYPLEFLCVPFFLWAAFRFGRREVATAMAILAGIAVWGSAQGFGPFVRDTPQESLVLIQAYICTLSIMVTVLAATVAGHKAAEAKLEELALTDPLTGLANYRRLLDVLRIEIARSNRTRRPLTVLLLDMNGLKRINDRFGHLTGSRALVRLGNVLRKACRTIDTPARFGGDEFVIVLPDTPAEGGTAVLRRIEEQLAADADSPVLSVSGGIATFPEDGETPTLLLRHADAQLYDVKTRRQRSRRTTPGVDEKTPKKIAKLF
jgi:diguanylate cyclase (GGDEF)-like protein